MWPVTVYNSPYSESFFLIPRFLLYSILIGMRRLVPSLSTRWQLCVSVRLPACCWAFVYRRQRGHAAPWHCPWHGLTDCLTMAVALTATQIHFAVGSTKNNNAVFSLPPKSLSSCVASSSPLIINESSSACSAHRRSTGSRSPFSFSSITGLAAALIVASVPPSFTVP